MSASSVLRMCVVVIAEMTSPAWETHRSNSGRTARRAASVAPALRVRLAAEATELGPDLRPGPARAGALVNGLPMFVVVDASRVGDAGGDTAAAEPTQL